MAVPVKTSASQPQHEAIEVARVTDAAPEQQVETKNRDGFFSKTLRALARVLPP